MNTSSPSAIRNLVLNKKEKENKVRKRLGFHVFLSRYFYNFYQLTIYKQQQQIHSSIGVRVGPFNIDDGESVDFTNSTWKEKVSMHDVHRAACIPWKFDLPLASKNAWNRRTLLLNQRKLPGKFLRIPNNINGNKKGDSLKSNILDSLSMEWDTVVAFFKSSITRQPREDFSSTAVYKFGPESVRIGTQTYRDFLFSYLLLISLFGKITVF